MPAVTDTAVDEQLKTVDALKAEAFSDIVVVLRYELG